MSQAPLNNTAQLCLEGCSQLVNIIFPITCLHHRNPVLLRWAQKIWPHANSQAGGGHPAGDMFLVKFSSKDTKGLSRSVLIQSSLSSWELQKERKNSLSAHCCPACRQRWAFFPITPNIWNSTFLIMVAKRAFYITSPMNPSLFTNSKSRRAPFLAHWIFVLRNCLQET